jgi:hypothetical protein
MNPKIILGWLAIAVIIWWVIEQPAAVAHLIHNIGAYLSTAAAGLSNFVSSI